MKMFKGLIVLLAVVFVSGLAFADPENIEKQDGPEKVVCAKGYSDKTSCVKCHTTPNHKLKEGPLGEGTFLEGKLNTENGKTYLIYNFIGEVNQYKMDDLREIRNYMISHPDITDRIVIDILSPGGNVWAMWDIIGVINDFKARGYTVETRCRGFIASAAFVIFSSGSKGHRYISPTAEAMWHEVSSFAFFDSKNPSKLEDEARIFRHLQDTGNHYLASVSKVSKEFLDEKVNKDEWWVNGQEMYKFGFADKLIK